MNHFANACTYEGENAVLYYTGGPMFYHVGGHLNWRNNNPGNCISGTTSKKFNEIGVNGRFAIFASVVDGRNCMEYVIFNTYGTYSIADMMYKYAPPSENDTEAYISMIVNETGLGRNTILNTLSSSNRQALLNVMIRKEGTQKGRVVQTDVYPV